MSYFNFIHRFKGMHKQSCVIVLLSPFTLRGSIRRRKVMMGAAVHVDDDGGDGCSGGAGVGDDGGGAMFFISAPNLPLAAHLMEWSAFRGLTPAFISHFHISWM